MAPAAVGVAVKTARTVHIKLYPTPRTFPERREVLRVLERFGEVEMLKSLKYEPASNVPNAFFSLFATESAAQDIINASPVRYRLITEAPSADPSDPLFSADPAEDTKSKAASLQEETMFELSASPTGFDHTKYIRDPYTNPLHGPYNPVSEKSSYIAASLGQNLPQTLWSSGLKDWESANMRWRNDRTPAAHSDMSAAVFAHKRERERKQKRLPTVMRGLRELAEQRAQRDAESEMPDKAKEPKTEPRDTEPRNLLFEDAPSTSTPMRDSQG